MQIEHQTKGNIYFFPCPVHGGDNPTGACIYAHDRSNWKCWTHGCHETYGTSIFGFIRGFLSREKGSEATPREVFQFIEGKISLEKRLIDLERVNFIQTVEMFTDTTEDEELPKLKPRLTVPSEYFINRGINPETLKKFGVGDCYDGYNMDSRAVVPICNKNNIVVGFSGRTTIDSVDKWKHSYGLCKSNHLYGLNLSQEHILKSGVAIIVESPGNIWRLDEAGFYNYGGIMGAYISERQITLLEKAGALHLIILTDMDEPGRQAGAYIKKICGRRFTYSMPKYPANDIMELQVQQVKELLEKEKLSIW